MKGLRGIPRLYHVTYTKKGRSFKTRTWYADVWRDGICKRQAFGRDKTEAVKALKRLLSDRGLMQAGEVTVDDLLRWVEDDYRANKKKSLPNLLPRAVRLRGFFVSTTKASEITTDRVRAYRAQRQKDGAANATINVELAALARGFSLGILYDRLTYRPKFPHLAENNARKGFFERPEFEAVASHLPLFLQPVAWVCYLTGWRPKAEILTREWKHVDFRQGWLRLEPHETKNGDGREVPFGAELRAVLHGQRQRCDVLERDLGRIIPWVFFTDEGRRITHYHQAWDAARRAAGMPHKLLYDCRRTKVRNLERAGVPRSAGKAMVGHRTDAIYSRYAIVDAKMLQEAASVADKFEAAQAHGPVKVKPIGRKKP
jgi:integrase